MAPLFILNFLTESNFFSKYWKRRIKSDISQYMSSKIIVSACLAGFHCRYDCASQERESIRIMVENGDAIAVCPEQMGGLPTPRVPAEIQGEKVLSKIGTDVSMEYLTGAQEAMRMAEMVNAKEAYLKSKSPMCGSGLIYDGTFSGTLTSGDGVFTRLLKKRGIKIHRID